MDPAIVSPFGPGVVAAEEPQATQLQIGHVEASSSSSRGQADRSERRLPSECTHTIGITAEASPRRMRHAHVFVNPRMHSASRNRSTVVAIDLRALSDDRLDQRRPRPREAGSKATCSGRQAEASWQQQVHLAKLAVAVKVEKSAAYPGHAEKWRPAFARRKRVLASTQKNSARQHAQSSREWSARTTGIRQGALRLKQLHAGTNDSPVVFLPGQSLPRSERLQRCPIAKRMRVVTISTIALSPFTPSCFSLIIKCLQTHKFFRLLRLMFTFP